MDESDAVPVRDEDKSRDIRDMIERFLATSMNVPMERRGDGRWSALIKRGRPFISHSPPLLTRRHSSQASARDGKRTDHQDRPHPA